MYVSQYMNHVQTVDYTVCLWKKKFKIIVI